MTVVNGTSYPGVVSADGRYVTSTFAGGILIQKGYSVDAYLQGDIVGSNASGRIAQFDIDKTSDVYFVGQLYGYGVSFPYNSSGTASTASTHGTTYTSAGQPVYQGSTVSITGASVTTVAKASEVPAQNVAVNVPNQTLGGYVVDLRGEAVSVGQTVITVSTSTASGAVPLTNVTIVDSNGAVVAGPVDMTSGSTALTFTNSITYKTGRQVFTIKGKLASGFSNNATVVLSTTPSSQWTNITGQVSGNSISFAGFGIVTMNTMTVKSASLAISMGSQPATQTIVAGTQGREMAQYVFNATQSGEDVRFSSMNLTLGGSGTVTNLTSCQLFDGATALNTGSNTLNPTSATPGITLDNSVTVTKGTSKTLSMKCNIAAGTTGTFIWGITTSSSNPSVTGVTSSNSVTASGGTLTANTLTMSAGGSYVLSKHASSKIYALVPGGTTGQELGVVNLRATNEAVNLTRLGLKLTSGAASDITTVTIWQGATQVGSAQFDVGSSYATTTFQNTANGYVTLAKDQDVQLTLKGDVAMIGTSYSGTPGQLIQVDTAGTEATGVDSGSTLYGTGSTSFAGVRLQKTVPTITYSTTAGTAQTGLNDLLSVVVAADAKGDVTMRKLTFAVSTTTANATTFTFNGPNGNVSSSSPIVTYVSAGSVKVTVFFDSASNTSDKTIGAGTSKTYTLRVTDLSLTGSNSTGSIGAALKADTSHAGMSKATAITSSNIIWSPVSTTSVSSLNDEDNDWTNGYGIPGCFATSGLGQDCTSRTLSK